MYFSVQTPYLFIFESLNPTFASLKCTMVIFRATLILSLLFLLSCKSTSYYIVRHAEKQQGTAMNDDPPLSVEGEKQTMDLKNFLLGKNIKAIYTTNYIRTKATAEPLQKALGLELKFYDAQKPEQLTNELKNFSGGNVLVVGHSNTVDDVVNALMGETKMNDLADTEYGNVFIVKKKGNSYSFERLKVPQTTAR